MIIVVYTIYRTISTIYRTIGCMYKRVETPNRDEEYEDKRSRTVFE